MKTEPARRSCRLSQNDCSIGQRGKEAQLNAAASNGHNTVIFWRRALETAMLSCPKRLDLNEQCRAPFFELVARGLLKHSIMVVDQATATTIQSLGGLDFLYGLGVANAVNIDLFAAPVNDKDTISKLDGLRCLFIPQGDGEATRQRHLVFFVSGVLWAYESYFVNAMMSRTGTKQQLAFERITILSTLSEKGHECFPVDHENGKSVPPFHYDEFAVRVSQRAFQEEHTTVGVAKLNVRFFPMLVRPVRIGSHIQCFEVNFTDGKVPSEVWFPPLPHVFPPDVQLRCERDINKLKISDLSTPIRRKFRGLANILVCIMAQLNLDPRECAFSVGHEHSSQILGETMLTNLTEGPDGLISVGDLKRRQKVSFLIIDRTVDLVAPNTASSTAAGSSSMQREQHHHVRALEAMQDHTDSGEEIVAQVRDMFCNSANMINAKALLMLTLRAFALSPPGSITHQLVESLVEPICQCMNTHAMFKQLVSSLVGIDDVVSKIDLLDRSIHSKSDENGTGKCKPSDTLDWGDEDEGWGDTWSESGEITAEQVEGNHWNSGDDLFDDTHVTPTEPVSEVAEHSGKHVGSNAFFGGNDGIEDVTGSSRGASGKALTRAFLSQMEEVHLARSHLSEFRYLIGPEGTYRPFLRSVLEHIREKVSPENISDMHCLKDYSAAERTVTGVTETLTDLLGGFFSSATASVQMPVAKNEPQFWDRPIIFIFVVGGLTEMEIESMQTSRLVQEDGGIQLLVGTTNLLRGGGAPVCPG